MERRKSKQRTNERWTNTIRIEEKKDESKKEKQKERKN